MTAKEEPRPTPHPALSRWERVVARMSAHKTRGFRTAPPTQPRITSSELKTKGRPKGGPGCASRKRGSAQVLVDERRHLEHRHLLLPVEDLPQVVVCVDHAPVGLVLQAIGLDVVPHLLRHLTARYRLTADDRREIRARLHLGGQTFAATLGSGSFLSRHQ